MVVAEKTVQLPPGDLGVAFGKQLQKACVIEVANSSEMKGKLQKGDIVIGFKDDGVEHRNLTLPYLVSKLNATKHSHFRSITVVETDFMDERAIVRPPKSYRKVPNAFVSPSIRAQSSSMVSSSTSKEPPELPDELLVALVRETAINEGITDYDEGLTLETIKQSLKARKAPRKVFIDDSDISVQSSCARAALGLAREAVGLAMCASGMPSGPGKEVAKLLVAQASTQLRHHLNDEIMETAVEYFGSLNPANIAAGLGRIMNVIRGNIGFDEITGAIYDTISWWDAVKIVATLSLYFVSSGGGLAARLAFMTPDLIDVVEAAVEVKNCC